MASVAICKVTNQQDSLIRQASPAQLVAQQHELEPQPVLTRAVQVVRPDLAQIRSPFNRIISRPLAKDAMPCHAMNAGLVAAALAVVLQEERVPRLQQLGRLKQCTP